MLADASGGVDWYFNGLLAVYFLPAQASGLDKSGGAGVSQLMKS